MLREILYVGIGGFAGGIARYLVSTLIRWKGNGFPWGTFIVNMVGCLLVGMLVTLFNRLPNASSHLNLLLTVGFCGAFTTFSTFSKESLSLLQSGNYITFTFYVVGSIVLGITAVVIGYAIAK